MVRFHQIGKWLKTNGEAIYGTKKWKKPVQWSEGNRDYKPEGMLVGGDMVLKQTIDPEPGYAVKELFFTQKNGALYAILPKWPNKKIIVKGVNAVVNSKVNLLGQKGDLTWKNKGKDLIIEIPSKDNYNFSDEEYYAFVIKISKVN